jgi:iron donor protein CyaY
MAGRAQMYCETHVNSLGKGVTHVMRESRLSIAWDGARAADGSCYTGGMMDELEFRRQAEAAIEGLKQRLIDLEEDEEAGFEVEEQNGVLNVVFEEPAGKFVITPNTPVRQIWISARSTSFKLDFEGAAFVLARTGEKLTPLVERLIHEHLEG